MIIEGNPKFIVDNDFRPKIQQALDLLQAKAGTDYLTLTTVTEKIRAASRTGAVYMDAIINVGKRTFDSSLTWLASVLVHESFHIAQFRCGKPYVGKNAEGEANIIQLYTLRLIGAPESEMKYLLAQDKHYDLNGDGKYDQKDYELRDY